VSLVEVRVGVPLTFFAGLEGGVIHRMSGYVHQNQCSALRGTLLTSGDVVGDDFQA
jgi:hypothetical protein